MFAPHEMTNQLAYSQSDFFFRLFSFIVVVLIVVPVHELNAIAFFVFHHTDDGIQIGFIMPLTEIGKILLKAISQSKVG